MENKKVDLYSLKYKNSRKPIDWTYYTQFYPNITEAIKVLRLDTGLGLKDAKDVIDEIFRRIEKEEIKLQKSAVDNSEVEAARHEDKLIGAENRKKAAKTVGKGVGLGIFTIGYTFFGTIFKLTEMYSGKKRR